MLSYIPARLTGAIIRCSDVLSPLPAPSQPPSITRCLCYCAQSVVCTGRERAVCGLKSGCLPTKMYYNCPRYCPPLTSNISDSQHLHTDHILSANRTSQSQSDNLNYTFTELVLRLHSTHYTDYTPEFNSINYLYSLLSGYQTE